MSKFIKVTRMLTYIGPEDWINTTKDKSYVVLAKALGQHRVILSVWNDPVEVSEAEVVGQRTMALGVEKKLEESRGK